MATPIKVRTHASAAGGPGLTQLRRVQPRTSISFGDSEPAEATTTPFRSSIHIVPGGAHETWSGFADTQVSPASQKFHASFRSMGVGKARGPTPARALTTLPAPVRASRCAHTPRAGSAEADPRARRVRRPRARPRPRRPRRRQSQRRPRHSVRAPPRPPCPPRPHRAEWSPAPRDRAPVPMAQPPPAPPRSRRLRWSP